VRTCEALHKGVDLKLACVVLRAHENSVTE
jgi:hypothetical protein